MSRQRSSRIGLDGVKLLFYMGGGGVDKLLVTSHF